MKVSLHRITTFGNDRKIQKQALSAALNILQETVGASKIEDIAVNFESQLRTQTNLLNEAENLQKQKQELSKKLATVEDSLKSSQYDQKFEFNGASAEELKKSDMDNINRSKNLENQLNEVDRYIKKISEAINVY